VVVSGAGCDKVRLCWPVIRLLHVNHMYTLYVNYVVVIVVLSMRFLFYSGSMRKVCLAHSFTTFSALESCLMFVWYFLLYLL
jgi:hypothetical protein